MWSIRDISIVEAGGSAYAIRLKRLDGDDSNERYIEVCLSNEEKERIRKFRSSLG